jgi:hypothetical protein
MQEIVKVATQSGWIGARELLNLEQTCKKARAAVSTEEVWEALCLRKWPNTNVKRAFIQRRGGYRTWYKLRASKPPQRDSSYAEEPLPPPSLRAEDFDFLVDIKVGDDTVISTIDSGNNLPILFRYGEAEILVSFGSADVKYELGDTNEILSTDDFTSKDLTVEVQMVTDSHTCKIMMPTDRYFFERQAVEESHGKRGAIYPSFEEDDAPPTPNPVVLAWICNPATSWKAVLSASFSRCALY